MINAAIPLGMVESPDVTIAVGKAKDFVKELEKAFDKLNHENVAGRAFEVINRLFDLLGQDHLDFGYMVSFQSPETPAIDDIFFGAQKEVYDNLVNRYPEFDRETDGYMTRGEAFAAFVSLMSREVLTNYPIHSPLATIKQHVVRTICSMFDGSNQSNIQFTLRYTETDPVGEGDGIVCTKPLGEYLNQQRFNF